MQDTASSGKHPPQSGLRLTPMRALLLVAAALAVGLLITNADLLIKGPKLGDEWRYQADLTTAAEEIYTETDALPTGLDETRAMALGADGRVYVSGDGRIRVIDAAGSFSRDIPTGGTAECLAVADDGTIYAGIGGRVVVYDADGTQKATWDGFGEKAIITSIAPAGSEVVVADAGNRIVLVCTPEGEVTRRIGAKDEERNIPGLVVPSPHMDVAMGSDGLLRVANPGRHRVEIYTLSGDLEFSWGKSGCGVTDFTGCCNPADIAVMPDGSVVTSEKGEPRVKLYEGIAGAFIGMVAGPQAFAGLKTRDFGPAGFPGLDLAVDKDGRVLVLDPARREVRVFVPKAQSSEKPGGRIK